MPRVSVIIPTYNRAHLIPETLESVLAQTYRDFEVIVVDDGSVDETLSVLDKYHAAISVIRQKNLGAGIARNTGIEAAQGEYVAFVDDDDIWVPFKLERQMAFFDNQPDIFWVYSDAYAFENDSQQVSYIFSQLAPQYEGFVAKQLLIQCFIPSPTPVIHRSVFEHAGLWNNPLKGQDWDMWLRIAALYVVGRVPEILAGYRVHANRMSERQDMLIQHQHLVDVVNSVRAFAPEVYEPIYREGMAARCLLTARTLAGADNMSGTRQMLAQAIHYQPMALQPYLLWVATFLGSRILRSIIQINWLRRKLFASLIIRSF